MYTFIFNFCNCLSCVFFRDFFRDFFGDLVCGVKEIVQMSKDVVEVDSKSRSYYQRLCACVQPFSRDIYQQCTYNATI